MSKRRISKQQSVRIEKKHQLYRQQTELERDDLTNDGLVITRYSRHAHIEDSNGRLIHCAIRPDVDSLVAGDRVVWQAEGERQGVVLSRYPRQSVLGRPDASNKFKAVAANISQILIVIAPKPTISWILLDSYLVMAEFLHLNATIVLNKTDLPCDELQKQLLQQYEPLGYPLLFTRADTLENKLLETAVNNQVTVFVGQSGVGKSSLITRLLPHEKTNIATGDLASGSELGAHTTSHSRLYHIPTGGSLIDSPGVREFKLWNMPATDIAKNYREFREYLPQCKFRNCNHRNAPNCAVINAVKNKLISPQRYENYVKISELFEK